LNLSDKNDEPKANNYQPITMIDLNKIVRKNILALKPYSSARDEFKGTADVFLDANENPFGTLNRYPDPNKREVISN